MSLGADPLAGEVMDEIEGLHGTLPEVGTTGLRVLSPTILEVALVNGVTTSGAPDSWNFVVAGSFVAPAVSSYQVQVDGVSVASSVRGFRRRPLYAPLAHRDLRVDNRMFLELQDPLPAGALVSLTTMGWDDSGDPVSYTAEVDPFRRSPAIHVNQEGYQTTSPKQAMVGYYLGTSGELAIPSQSFAIVDQAGGQTVFSGTLTLRADRGYVYEPTPYQQVWQADFSALETPGSCRLVVPGLGASLPFRIADDMLMSFVRAYAQGLYNQRCGHAVELPYSRHIHAECHTAAAEIPLPAASFSKTWNFVSAASADAAGMARHSAPVLATAEDQLYPILKTGVIDVSGGHHDAGDYSKYTINSAQLIHHLVFAVDGFPEVGSLDNLGLPESGDGLSDLLQEAVIEADFLAKMQDEDGGFFFLVYPKERKYEEDVLPHEGDAQVVWPKNTSATAAAVGALADLASSPLFQEQFPERATLYLAKAQAGWDFLLNAIQEHGKDGSYQKITHYGNEFLHDDELAWAAAAMFAATGEASCQEKLIEWYDPEAEETFRWGWFSLFEGYGCAARSYAFAVRSGKRQATEMDQAYLAKMDSVLIEAGNRIRIRSEEGAYGSSLDVASKRHRVAGWFFGSERAFDCTVGNLLEEVAGQERAVWANLNYEFGCNPLNVSYLTGSGLRQQREIVHQYAQNDRRILPPSGIPLGNIQSGFSWLPIYQASLGALVFPPDGAAEAPYPFYDRWADTYNVTTEFVVSQQARSLASLAAWAAQKEGAATPWHPPAATLILPLDYVVAGEPITVSMFCPGVDLSSARVTWEVGDQEPVIGASEYSFVPRKVIRQWIEAEAVLPDGRRVSAAGEFAVRAASGLPTLSVEDETVALWHLDGDLNDAGPNGFELVASGAVEWVEMASGWMAEPSGMAMRFHDLGDQLTLTIPDSYLSPGQTCTPLSIEAQICILGFTAHGRGNDPFLELDQGYGSELGFTQKMWADPPVPFAVTGIYGELFSGQQWSELVQVGTWQSLKLSRDENGHFECRLDNVLVGTLDGIPLGLDRENDWLLTIGNFNGYLDEIRISGLPGNGGAPPPGGGGDGDPPVGGDPLVRPFSTPYVSDDDTIALYHFDGDYQDSGPNGFHLTLSGNPQRVAFRSGYEISTGEFVRFSGHGDQLEVTIPDSYLAPGATAYVLTLEAWIFPRAYTAYANGTASILSLYQSWNSSLSVQQDKWLLPTRPLIVAGTHSVLSNENWDSVVKRNCWQHLKISQSSDGTARLWVDHVEIAMINAPVAASLTNDWTFKIGDIDADFDEIRISKSLRIPPLDPPGNLSVVASSPVRASLNWTNPALAPEIIIERSFDGVSNWTTVANPEISSTTIDDSGLTPGQTYYYLAFSRAGATISPPTAPVIFIAPALSPFQDWVATGGFQVESDPLARSENGSPLLLSYALGVSASLVVPADSVFKVFRSGDRLHVTYPRPRAEIEYRVEQSSDLEEWTPLGVDQGPSGPNGNASIPFDQSRGRYLRLSVSLPGS